LIGRGQWRRGDGEQFDVEIKIVDKAKGRKQNSGWSTGRASTLLKTMAKTEEVWSCPVIMMGLQKKVSQLRQVDHFVGVIIPLDDEHCLGENNCGVRPYVYVCVWKSRRKIRDTELKFSSRKFDTYRPIETWELCRSTLNLWTKSEAVWKKR